MHTSHKSSSANPRLTSPVTKPTQAPAVIMDTDPTEYQSAKGCLQLSLMILGAAVVCIGAGYGVHLYLEATIG